MKLLLSISLATALLGVTAYTEEPTRKEPAPCCSAHSERPQNNTVSLSDVSLYQLDSAWTNDTQNALQLSTLRGKPQVVTLFFASCNYACPLLVYDMQRIEKALPPELRSKVGFTLMTIDPERDTPAVLNAYRTTHKLGQNWTLLRGSNDDVLELAAIVGVKFKKEPTGQFAHSNVITVLNSEGEIVTQQIGLNRDPAPTVTALEQLLKTNSNQQVLNR